MTVHTATTGYTCGWSVETCCNVLEDAFASGDGAKVAIAQRSLDSAAEILYALSGRQFGLCELTIRPCRIECCNPCDMVGPRWTPVLVGGQWTNVSCRSCRDVCSCTKVCEVRLPGPIESITQVKLNGVVLDPSAYRVDNQYFLVALEKDGEDFCWPTCQDMNEDSDQDRTWEVTYKRGRPVPAGGVSALGELACELCKACLGDDSCCLPRRVTSVSRQGVSFAVLDPMTFIDKGLTGLYLVDLWIRSVNPKQRTRRAALLSPDMPLPRKTTS